LQQLIAHRCRVTAQWHPRRGGIPPTKRCLITSAYTLEQSIHETAAMAFPATGAYLPARLIDVFWFYCISKCRCLLPGKEDQYKVPGTGILLFYVIHHQLPAISLFDTGHCDSVVATRCLMPAPSVNPEQVHPWGSAVVVSHYI
jgi:hypothetical protein